MLKAVDALTVTIECDGDNKEKCNGKDSIIVRDGYYIMVVLCAADGIIWISFTRNKFNKFDKFPKETSWSVLRNERKEKKSN